MPHYWVIAPVKAKPPELFDKVWAFDRDNNLISIGWSELGDVSTMSREELIAAVASTYRDKPAGTRGLYVNMLRAFYHEISPGDFVIARRGRKTLAAVGEVIKPAFYAPGKIPLTRTPITWKSNGWNNHATRFSLSMFFQCKPFRNFRQMSTVPF